jgi:SAM-dependent methyltransferase
MISRLKACLRRTTQKRLAFSPDRRGIKSLLRLHDRLYFFTLGTIKIYEKSKGGIHPKHWVTDFHNFFVRNVEPSDSVLEVGCAYGHVSSAVAEKAEHVVAIDIRPEAIEEAKGQFNRENLVFACSDFLSFPEEDKFDVVILSNVLEHIEERIPFLRKASRIGKILLVRVPAFDRDWLVPYKKSLGLEWRLNRDHKLEYTERELREEIEKAGLKINRIFCEWGNYCCIASKRSGEEE